MPATVAPDLSLYRPELAEYCRRLVPDRDTAEDLAQETLLVALRQAGAGRTILDWSSWLKGIARLLARSERSRTYYAPEVLTAEPAGTDDPLDALLDAERGELLDRALAYLEPDARALLLGRYLGDLPTDELAGQLGITENALHARLHRARQGLQQVLATRLYEDARTHGLLPADYSPGEAKTNLLCPRCGIRYLMGTLSPQELYLRCVACDAPGSALAGLGTRTAPLPAAQVLAGASGFRVAQRRVNDWWQTYLSDARRTGTARCTRCLASAAVTMRHPLGMPGLTLLCPRCAAAFFIAPTGLLFHSPDGQAFWHEHGRIVSQLAEPIRFRGTDAIRVCFQTHTTRVRLEAVFRTDDMAVLHQEKK